MSPGRPCKACGMPIVFAPAKNGAILPLQRVLTVYTIDDGVAVKMVTSETLPRYVSHYETCYRASEFSKKGKVK